MESDNLLRITENKLSAALLAAQKLLRLLCATGSTFRPMCFYLGFTVVTRLKRPAGVFFTLGEQHHDLAVLAVPPDAAPVTERQVGLHHVALQVENFTALQECYRQLKAHDVRITATIGHFITKSIYFLDPEGNQFELYCDEGEDDLERIKRGDMAAFAPLKLDS